MYFKVKVSTLRDNKESVDPKSQKKCMLSRTKPGRKNLFNEPRF